MASRVKRFAEHQLDLMDVVLEGCPQDTPRIPPGYPDDIHDPEGRGTDLVLSHLRDGKVIKEHTSDLPCDLCKSRNNGQTNGRMEYRIS